MDISKKIWDSYVKNQSKMNSKAVSMMQDYIKKYGLDNRQALIKFAYGVATKYGEGSSALACQLYDYIAKESGMTKLLDAVPADTATYGEVATAVNGTLKRSDNPDVISGAIGNLVKLAGLDTLLRNAKRDGAEFAWIPSGAETCAFCMTLASNGWRRATEEVMRGNHAEHVHANCDCTFAIRFNEKTNVQGYDPEYYLNLYNAAEGRSSKDKINYMRRQIYAERK